MFNRKTASRENIEAENALMEHLYLALQSLLGDASKGFSLENIERCEKHLAQIKKILTQ